MEEMYWITRLNGICTFLAIFGFIMVVVAIICLVISFNDFEFDEKTRKKGKKWSIISICISLLSFLILIFIPSEIQMYKIIGIGGTYDYLKNNKNIKNIPDNTIKALEIWSNNIILDQQIENKELKEDSVNNK